MTTVASVRRQLRALRRIALGIAITIYSIVDHLVWGAVRALFG